MPRRRGLGFDDFFFRFGALDWVRLGAEGVFDKIESVRSRVAPFPCPVIPIAREEGTERGQAGADDSHVHLDIRPRGSPKIGIWRGKLC